MVRSTKSFINYLFENIKREEKKLIFESNVPQTYNLISKIIKRTADTEINKISPEWRTENFHTLKLSLKSPLNKISDVRNKITDETASDTFANEHYKHIVDQLINKILDSAVGEDKKDFKDAAANFLKSLAKNRFGTASPEGEKLIATSEALTGNIGAHAAEEAQRAMEMLAGYRP